MSAKVKRTRKPVPDRVEEINKMLRGGERSLRSLCGRLGLKPSTVHHLCKKNSIKLPEGIKPWGVWPDVDGCIKKGYVLREIKEHLEKTVGESPSTQRLCSYIAETHQQRLWEAGKKEREGKEASALSLLRTEKTQTREYIAALLGLLKNSVLRRAAGSSWAEQKAIEYHLSLRHHYKSYKLDTLVELFRIYDHAKNKGEKLTLEELGDKVGLHFVSVGKIFQRVHVEPMYGAHPRLNNKERQKVVEALELGVSGADITYFSSIPHEFILALYRGSIRRNGKAYARFSEKEGYIPLRIACDVYEAVDLEFTPAEISVLFERKEAFVRRVVAQREVIEPRISGIEGLFSLGYDGKKS